MFTNHLRRVRRYSDVYSFSISYRMKHSMRSLFRPSSIIHDSNPTSGNGKSDGSSHTTCKSLRLMTDLGLIQPTSAGTYHLLPLGLKSLEKLTNTIDHFMMGIGGQKIQMPTLTFSSLWKKSGRLAECESELMKMTDRENREYILSPTHEEAVCDLLNNTNISYKQLPLRLYQITNKFRDELRPRFGLLRGREFLMKDLYTFDKSEKDGKITYDEVNTAYSALFDYIGVNWIKARGSGGTIGGSVSHEFHFLSSAGEDRIQICQQCSEIFNEELVLHRSSTTSAELDTLECLNCGSKEFMSHVAIEVGHSFLLGTKYTKPLNATFVNFSGKSQSLEMGCYGLGVSRILASVIEVLSTNTDIRWPLPLVPYSIAIIPPKNGSKEEQYVGDLPEVLVNYLNQILPNDVLVDDRSEFTIGRRFKDLKMLGIPYVIVLGKRLMEKPRIIELHDVYGDIVTDLTMDQVFNYCCDLKSKWKMI